MHLRWEVWGIVGVIGAQTVCIWFVFRLAAEIARIYWMSYP